MRQEEVENITLKAIANELFISSSTVIRACKKLGYQTYNELRYDLRLSKELKKNQAKLEHNSKNNPTSSSNIPYPSSPSKIFKALQIRFLRLDVFSVSAWDLVTCL